jgi:hypothetical protein
MREPGIPKLLTWRWAPCLALVLGALSFCAFALLAIPDQIGGLEAGSSSSMRLGNQLTRTQTMPGASDWSGSDASGDSDEGKPSAASPANHLASRGGGNFPKRGFTPPLDRPAPPPNAAPPPVPPPVVALPPAAAVPAVPPPEAEAAPAPPPTPPPADPAAAAQVAAPAN